MRRHSDAETKPDPPALRRLRQLAREERAAVQAADVDALCRIAELLPAAVASLQARPADYSPQWTDAIAEIQRAQQEAESFLARQMRDAARRLELCGRARRRLQGHRSFHETAPGALDCVG